MPREPQNPTEEAEGKEKSRRRHTVFLMANSLETDGTERQFAALAHVLRSGPFAIELGCLERTGSFLHGLGEVAEFPLGGSFFSWQAQRARLALARHLRAKRMAIAHSFDFYSSLFMIPMARQARAFNRAGFRLGPCRPQPLPPGKSPIPHFHFEGWTGIFQGYPSSVFMRV
jgi:hypothetical protein